MTLCFFSYEETLMDWAGRIGVRLKLRDLHVLLAVVEWRSMAKAARHLAISQPVVSRAIADLERSLGVRLFDRTPQGVEPTIYGRTVLNRSLAVFDELRESANDIKFLLDPMAGELRIGCNEGIAGGLLAAILDRLSAQRPRLTFQIKIGEASTIHYRELRERTVDLLLSWIVEMKSDDVSTEVLLEDRLYVVADVSNRLTRRRKISLKDLVGEPWILPPADSNPTALVMQAFRASDLGIPHLAVAGYGLNLQGALLSNGRFLSVLPGLFLKIHGKRLGLKALPIDLPIPARPIGIVTLKNRTLSPLARLFIDCARKLSKQYS
jgi:DNA-binding transcriptional LysR family regulator